MLSDTWPRDADGSHRTGVLTDRGKRGILDKIPGTRSNQSMPESRREWVMGADGRYGLGVASGGGGLDGRGADEVHNDAPRLRIEGAGCLRRNGAS